MKETKTMKKLMIAAAVAAMTAGAFAGACDDPEEVLAPCRAWDVSMSLKTLCPKKINCVKDAGTCDEAKDQVYFLDNCTRKIKGYLWVCEYDCEKAFNVCLWDAKNKVAVIPVTEDAVAFDEVYVYGKKANKVAGTLQFAGTDLAGEDSIEVTASGINGKMVRGGEDNDCYIKSLSGYVAGKMAYIKPGSRAIVTSKKGGLCDDPEEVIEVCDEYAAKLLTLCDACCFTSWCEVEDDFTEMVPAVGTWSMKYNKKVSKGNRRISELVPGYAL